MTAKQTAAPAEGQPTDKVAIPPPRGVFAEPWSLSKPLRLLRVFGPAAIVASLAIGAGETIVVVRAGSWAGYDLLWVVLLSSLIKGVFLTYLLGRYTAISGEHVGHRLVRLPGPRGWFLIAIIVIELGIAPLAWVPIAKPCGHLFHFLLRDLLPWSAEVSTWENILTTCFVALACTAGLAMSFQRLERQQIVICAILVGGTIIGTLMVRPDFWQAFQGSINFGNVPQSFPSWTPDDARQYSALTVTTIFGYVGGSIMAYVVYGNWVGLHGWGLTGHPEIEAIRRHAFTRDRIDYLPDDPQEVRRLRQLCAPLRWDVGMGALVLFVVTATFMMAGAAVLYPTLAAGELQGEFEGWKLLTAQAHVWRNIHQQLVWVYYVCIVAALWGTLQALPEAYARVTQEFLQAIWPERRWSYSGIKRLICAYLFVSTTALVWQGISFDLLTQVAGFIVSNFGLALVMFAALYLNFKLPPAYRTRRLMLGGGVASALVLSTVAVISGWELAIKLFGSG